MATSLYPVPLLLILQPVNCDEPAVALRRLPDWSQVSTAPAVPVPDLIERVTMVVESLTALLFVKFADAMRTVTFGWFVNAMPP